MATSTEDYFGGVTGNKFYIDWKYPASSTNPVWSFRGSGTSGIGLADYDKTSLIASGSEIARITTQSFEHKHSVSYPTTEVSESYELRPIDYYVDVDTDPTSCSIQLFDASLVPNGWTSNIGDVAFSASVNPITIIASSSQLINNSASASLTGDGDAATLKSNGTEAWYIR